jgi:hypothetical protein
MSLDQAIRHGKERRRSYKQRGKPGEFDRSCRPHGAGRQRPCPWCQRARLFGSMRQMAEVDEQMRGEDQPVE